MDAACGPRDRHAHLPDGDVPPISHVGDPILPPCSLTTMIGLCRPPASRTAMCVGPPDVIVKASMTVFIDYLNAARIGDQTVHGGVIVTGCPTVIIGG